MALAQLEPAPPATPTPSPTAAPTPTPTPYAGSKSFPSARANVDRNRASDAAFMSHAALVALHEAALSAIVADRAANDDVRSLGREMADGCARSNDALTLLAKNAGLELPSALDGSRKSEVDRISGLSAQALDAAYLAALLREHDAQVESFRAQVKAGQEVELLAWVSATLPMLEEQQERIHEIAKALNIPAR